METEAMEGGREDTVTEAATVVVDRLDTTTAAPIDNMTVGMTGEVVDMEVGEIAAIVLEIETAATIAAIAATSDTRGSVCWQWVSCK